MHNIDGFFNSRDLFFDKFSLSDSKQAKTLLQKVTGESEGWSPTASALLELLSALSCYNSSIRSYTQRSVAIENCWNGMHRVITHGFNYLSDPKEIEGIIYTIFWLSGYQQRGKALLIAGDLFDALNGSLLKDPSDFKFKRELRVLYDVTYLGLYFSPQGHLFINLLKISKVAYFVLNEYSACSKCWDNIQNPIVRRIFSDTISLLASGIHLYGNSLQLYTAVKAFV